MQVDGGLRVWDTGLIVATIYYSYIYYLYYRGCSVQVDGGLRVWDTGLIFTIHTLLFILFTVYLVSGHCGLSCRLLAKHTLETGLASKTAAENEELRGANEALQAVSVVA